MDAINTQTQSKFSFHRVAMVAGFYYPIFKKQIWFYPAVSLAFGIFSFLLQYLLEPYSISGFFNALMSMVLALMFFWAPCVLGNEGRELEVSLPALWKEKAAFIIGYFFVAIPILVYGPYISSKLLLAALFLPETMVLGFEPGLFVVSISDIRVGLSSIDALVAMSTALFVMIYSQRRSFARAAVLSVVAHIGLGVITGLIVVIRLYYTGFDKLAEFAEKNIYTHGEIHDFEQLMTLLGMKSIIVIATLICIAYTALMVALVIRSIKKFQI